MEYIVEVENISKSDSSEIWGISSGDLYYSSKYWIFEYLTCYLGLFQRSRDYRNRYFFKVKIAATYGNYPISREKKYKGKKIYLIDEIDYWWDLKEREKFKPYKREILLNSSVNFLFERYIKKNFLFPIITN